MKQIILVKEKVKLHFKEQLRNKNEFKIVVLANLSKYFMIDFKFLK